MERETLRGNLEAALKKAETFERQANAAERGLARIKRRALVLKDCMTQALVDENVEKYEALRMEYDNLPNKMRKLKKQKEKNPEIDASLKEAWNAYKEDIHAEREKTAVKIKELVRELVPLLIPDLEVLDDVNYFYGRVYDMLGYQAERPEKDSAEFAAKPLLTSVLKAAGYDNFEALRLCAGVCSGNHENLHERLDALKKNEDGYFRRFNLIDYQCDLRHLRQMFGQVW